MRFAKRESWSFDGCSEEPMFGLDRLSIRERRSPVFCFSASDRVSIPDRLSKLSRLFSTAPGAISAVM
jgi:hypothetical protein